MSDDRTIRIGPEQPDRGPQRRNARIGTVVAVVLAALVLGLFVLRSGGDEDEPAPPLASESPPAVASEPPATAQPPPSPSPSAVASEPADEEPTDPTEVMPSDGDVTAFLDAYEAEHGDDATTRVADLDFDEVDEIVAARVEDDAVQIDVASWDGARYAISFSDSGGAADRLDELVVRDVNGEAGLELVTFQSAGEEGRSISLWGLGGNGRYTRQDARGGCWDGSNTFGIVGATVEAARLEATCDGSPLPPEAWPSDVYVWEDGAWTFSETLEPSQ